jgi:hypothetical protein
MKVSHHHEVSSFESDSSSSYNKLYNSSIKKSLLAQKHSSTSDVQAYIMVDPAASISSGVYLLRKKEVNEE